MPNFSRRQLILSSLATAALPVKLSGSILAKQESFLCPPCGCSLDGHLFSDPGKCPACDMVLTPEHQVDLGTNPAQLSPGAGSFRVDLGDSPPISVDYYLPENFSPESQIVLLMPGAGRNGTPYRDAWIEASRKQGFLVAALGFDQEHYNFAAYNLGGIVPRIKTENVRFERTGPNSRVAHLSDEDLRFEAYADRKDWTFALVDRVFERLVKSTRSRQEHYDIFGHSAGAQFLHRMALFHRKGKVRRIIAANSGFYTMSSFAAPFPLGVEGAMEGTQALANAFAQELVLLLGGDDNGEEVGGTFLRTPLVDQQGSGRLQRGTNFFNQASEQAAKMNVQFNWKIMTVPSIGHDHFEMGRAAAKLI